VNSEGVAQFVLPAKPDTLVPLVDPRDFGHIVLALLKEPSKYFGKKVLAAGESLTLPQVVETHKRGKLVNKKW
jgi:hypothetical protein